MHGCNSVAKKQLAMDGDKFFPCPSSPNCVSSMTEEAGHIVEPIPYPNISLHDAKYILIEVLNKEEQCKIISEKGYYIHAEFRSKVFTFIDDIEFYFPLNKKFIHVKSASRLGYYDFGKNKGRVKRIAEAFNMRISP